MSTLSLFAQYGGAYNFEGLANGAVSSDRLLRSEFGAKVMRVGVVSGLEAGEGFEVAPRRPSPRVHLKLFTIEQSTSRGFL